MVSTLGWIWTAVCLYDTRTDLLGQDTSDPEFLLKPEMLISVFDIHRCNNCIGIKNITSYDSASQTFP